MTNPFKVNLHRLQMPPGSGPSISIAGIELAADEDGVVEVPHEHVAALRSHGLTDAPPPAPKRAKAAAPAA